MQIFRDTTEQNAQLTALLIIDHSKNIEEALKYFAEFTGDALQRTSSNYNPKAVQAAAETFGEALAKFN